MTDTSNGAAAPRARTTRRYAAGLITLAVLALMAAVWFWATRQTAPTEAGFPHYTIVVVGAGALMAALVAAIRMSLADILELALDVIVGLFAVLGAMLKGLWNFVCGLFGWD